MIISETLVIISEILRLLQPKKNNKKLELKLMELEDALKIAKEELEGNDSPAEHQRDWNERLRRKSKPPAG